MSIILCTLWFQNDNDLMEQEIEIGTVTHEGQTVDPSHFDLLKVLGQGSFGKVCYQPHYNSPSMTAVCGSWGYVTGLAKSPSMTAPRVS